MTELRPKCRAAILYALNEGADAIEELSRKYEKDEFSRYDYEQLCNEMRALSEFVRSSMKQGDRNGSNT